MGIRFMSVYFSSVYFYMEIHWKVSMRSSLFTYACLPCSPNGIAFIHPPNKVVLADYDTHFYYFFSATKNKSLMDR